MSENRSDAIPKIRTFADDVAAAQARAQTPAAGEPVEQNHVPAEPVEVAPSAAVSDQTQPVAPPPPAPTEADDTFVNVDVSTATPNTEPEDIESAVGGGEIVQEKKRRRFRVLPAITSSLTGWAKGQAEDLTRAPEHETIEDPSKRAETVHQATTGSALPNADDFNTVATNIAKQPKVDAKDTLRVTKADELEAPQWTSSLSPTEAEPTKATAAPAVPAQPTKEETAAPAVPATPAAPAPSPTSPAPVTEAAATKTETPPPSKPEVTPAPTPAPPTPPVAEVPTTDTAPTPAKAAPKETTPEPTSDTTGYQYRATPPEPAPRDWRSWLVLGIVGVAAIALGTSVSMYVFEYLSEPDRVLAPTVPSAITVDYTQAVALQQGGSALLSSLRQAAASAGSGVVQVYPVVAADSQTTRVATAAEVLTIIPINADGTFIRNISGITFISKDQAAVGIILTVTSFETALGGMYRWENQIVADFGAYLGTSPATRFTDTTSSNRDLRVAKRADGTELIYTFIDRNTLLIATDRSLVAEVVARMQ